MKRKNAAGAMTPPGTGRRIEITINAGEHGVWTANIDTDTARVSGWQVDPAMYRLPGAEMYPLPPVDTMRAVYVDKKPGSVGEVTHAMTQDTEGNKQSIRFLNDSAPCLANAILQLDDGRTFFALAKRDDAGRLVSLRCEGIEPLPGVRFKVPESFDVPGVQAVQFQHPVGAAQAPEWPGVAEWFAQLVPLLASVPA